MGRTSMAILMMVLAVPVDAGQLHKCVDASGKSMYTDKPCANGSTSSVVATRTTSAGTTDNKDASADTLAGMREKLDHDSRKRDLESKIRQLEGQVAAYSNDMDREMSVLRRDKDSANNNLAGATYAQSISGEMQAVAAKYDAKIKSTQSQIDVYQGQLQRLQ